MYVSLYIMLIGWIPRLQPFQCSHNVLVFSIGLGLVGIESNPSPTFTRFIQDNICTRSLEFHQYNGIDSLCSLLCRSIPMRGWKKGIPYTQDLNRFDLRQASLLLRFANSCVLRVVCGNDKSLSNIEYRVYSSQYGTDANTKSTFAIPA